MTSHYAPGVRDRILVLERDREALAALRGALAAAELELVLVHDLSSALRAIDSTRPSALLVAVDQPEAEGEALLAALRQHRSAGELPLLVIDGTRRAIVDAPVVSRPINATSVVADLRALINAHRPRIVPARGRPTAPARPPEESLDVQLTRVATAAEEAARAALEESLERSDRVFRWTRQRESAREALRAVEKATGTGADLEALDRLSWLTGVLEQSGMLQGRFVAAGDPPRRSRLNASDEAFLEALGSGAALEHARAGAGLSEARAQALALIAIDAGWLEPAPAPLEPAQQAEPSPPVAPRAAETTVRRAELDLGARWSQWLEAYRDRDYFDILGVGPNANASQIQGALERRRSELSLEEVPGSEALSTLKREVERLLEEGAGVLTHPQLGPAYRRNRSP